LKYLSQEEVGWRKKEEAGCRTTASNSSTGTTGEPCGNIENDHNRKTARRSRYKLASNSRFTMVLHIEDCL